MNRRGREGVIGPWLLRLQLVLFLFRVCSADPISLGVGFAVAAGSGGFFWFRQEIRCRFFECCDAPHIAHDFANLRAELEEWVYGQHLVQETLLPSLRAHFTRQPSKPLVLSFHGATGSGKNHVARIIARNLYKKGMASQFVHHIVATAEFPDKSRMYEYQLDLQSRLQKAVADCPRSLFIFDEVDKLPESLLGAIKPFLDYHDSVRGIDFRQAIFILLSNAGGEAISKQTITHRREGRVRTQLKAASLERTVSEHVFNTAGGLRMSELISNHLIDHFVPFLPLEREHVKRCVEFYLDSRSIGSSRDTEMVEEVMSSLQFYPSDDPVFSSSGCKRVEQKAEIALYKRRDKYGQRSTEQAARDTHDDI